MKETEIEEIIKLSLETFVPWAMEMTLDQFCDDCHKKHLGCFPCKTARTLTRRDTLGIVVEAQAILN